MASGDNGACPGGPPFLFDFTMRTRFILIQTSHAGNVGAAARAMKTMGFDDLVLVAPRWPNVLRREETIQRASGALDVLENARIVATLDEALDGMSHLCATAMTPRDFGPPAASPRAHFEMLLKKELLALDGKGLEVKNASNIEAPAAETGVATMRAWASTSRAPLARCMVSSLRSTFAQRGATSTRSSKPMVFMARATAPTLPAWLVWMRMKRVLMAQWG